jgi:thymidylate synthase (FAD)
MTQQQEIMDDPNYITVLDHGFCGLVDHMGDDLAIVQAARVSYGAGTRSVREDRGLIRYLLRHFHSSPIEMCEVKFHLKLPIFVMRQLIRHRTASTNEYSGRYSVMSDEFYVPESEMIQPQSTDNRQGRGGDLTTESKIAAQWLIKSMCDYAYKGYQRLLGDTKDQDVFGDDFDGVARELARTVLPVGNYTECYWKIDLSNLFKLLKLRTDVHAQYEIRVFAEAMFTLIQPIFPIACEAYVDYQRDAVTLSRMEVVLMRDLISGTEPTELLHEMRTHPKAVADQYDMTKRELDEFVERFADA